MAKLSVVASVVCTIFVFSLVLNPNVFSQAVNTSVSVLSHSSYVNSSGNFIVVGEVQNTANHALDSVSLDVVAFASDGSQIAADTTMAYVKDFLPQQKAPFYVDFGKIDFNAISNLSTVDFTVSNAPPTNYNLYPDLSLNVSFNGILNDVYVVSGSITNNGDQTANEITIDGTYYNNAGIVVAVGFVTLKDPLLPNKSASFTVSEFDASPNIVTKISDYALLVQTSTQIFSLPATASPSGSPVSIFGDVSIVAIEAIAVVGITVIIVAVLALFFLKKRSSHT